MRSFFFSRDMYGVALARVLHLLFAFLQRPLTWESKLSLLSILTPNNFSQTLSFIRDSPTPTQIFIGSLVLTVKWHLSVFPFIWLRGNHWINFSADSCKDEITSSMLLPESYIVLSSSYLEKSMSLITRNKLLRKMLNKIDPSIEPCRTPKNISSHEL